MATKKAKGPKKPAKKAAPRKTVAKKAALKKPAKKAAPKKTAAKKAAPKKPAKKAAPKKTAAKKATPKKTAAKKAAPKKPAKKAAPKKTAAKETAPKKTAARKAARDKPVREVAAKKAPATKKGEGKRKGAPKAGTKEYRPTARMGPDGILILSDDKVLHRAYYGGQQIPSPMPEGFLMLLGVRRSSDGKGAALFECSASSLRCQLSIPKATSRERSAVKAVQTAGDDPDCPRHGPGHRLVRAGNDLTCRLCGISYGKV
jgi:adenylate kinase